MHKYHTLLSYLSTTTLRMVIIKSSQQNIPTITQLSLTTWKVGAIWKETGTCGGKNSFGMQEMQQSWPLPRSMVRENQASIGIAANSVCEWTSWHQNHI